MRAERGFDSHTHFQYGAVVQRQETRDLKSLQCGFESHPHYQLPYNLKIYE